MLGVNVNIAVKRELILMSVLKPFLCCGTNSSITMANG